MPATSKTGLLPSVRKKIRFDVQQRTTLDISNLAIPAPYILRPFAGIYNPFPYGCSVLCNHPADLEAKNVVKRAKDTWAIEGRALLSPEDLSAIKYKRFRKSQKRRSECVPTDIGDAVPEELFRRYTDTDSRPITPTPTVVSLTTKHSQHLKSRRCVTPDPVSTCQNKERTLLILDLRRSHSQETVTWMASPQGDCATAQQGTSATSRTTSSMNQSTTSSPKKKKPGKKSDSLLTPTSAKADSQREIKSSRSLSGKQPEGKSFLTPDRAFDGHDGKIEALSSSGNSSETEVVRRRGKKKKNKKSGKEGEREFRGFPEPGETQVSTLGNESRAGSTRPSLTTVAGFDPQEADRLAAAAEGALGSPAEKDSFLDAVTLKQLQRQLDHEVVESELNVKKKIALGEALRLAPKIKSSQKIQEIKALKKELSVKNSDPEKWLSIPRVFTRQSARFELPLDSRTLNVMTPLEYSEKYVFPSEERLVLYNHVYNIHREEMDEEEDDHVERILLGKNVIPSLGDVMGRHMTPEEADDFRRLIGWSEDASLDFRTFAGVAAVCERLLAHRFCSKMPSPDEDLKHEIERADFEGLDYKLLHVSPDRRMVRILKGIRDL